MEKPEKSSFNTRKALLELPTENRNTTTLSEYSEEIVDTYNYLNDALSLVAGAKISNRVVLETGLVEVTYSNGVRIYVNYNYNDESIGSLKIPARDYKVVVTP